METQCVGQERVEWIVAWVNKEEKTKGKVKLGINKRKTNKHMLLKMIQAIPKQQTKQNQINPTQGMHPPTEGYV